MSDATVHSPSQTMNVDDELVDRLTRESDTGAVVASVPAEAMGPDAARKFLHAVHNVERGGLGGRKNLSESFAVELVSWRGEHGVGLRFVTSDEPTRNRFARYLRNYAESESAVESEPEPFMDVSSGDSLAAAMLPIRDEGFLTPDAHTSSEYGHEVRKRRKMWLTASANALHAMRGKSESSTDATVIVQFVCKPAISTAHKEWLNWHSDVDTRIGSILRTYRAILSEGSTALAYFDSSTPRPGTSRHGYHVCPRIVAVSNSPETATECVEQVSQRYPLSTGQEARPPVSAKQSETVAMQAANREWIYTDITLSRDSLATLIQPEERDR